MHYDTAGVPPVDVVVMLNGTFQAALTNLSVMVDGTLFDLMEAQDREDRYLEGKLIDVALQTGFFALFTVLAATAAYVLCLKGIKRGATAALLSAIAVMWASAFSYYITSLLAAATVFFEQRYMMSQNVYRLSAIQDCLGYVSGSASRMLVTESCQLELYESFDDYVSLDSVHYQSFGHQSCTGTVALTVNVTIGDSIVWWRAWVLWPNNRAVKLVCVLLILLTLGTGILDSVEGCHMGSGLPGSLPLGTMFVGDPRGLVAMLLSLLTNVVATTLIAYCAWKHRRLIKSHMQGVRRRTQVARTLALLVESGLLYCVLWVLIIAYSVPMSGPWIFEFGKALSRYESGLTPVVNDCLVSLIGMYPTLIIIVCAVDQSIYEKSSDLAFQGASLVFAAASVVPHDQSSSKQGELHSRR